MTEIEKTLVDHRFFKGINPVYVKILGGCASSASFAGGSTIFRQGGAADRFYIIDRGRVAIEVHRPGRGAIIIETLGDHEVLGVSWLFPPYRWQWDARAIEPTTAIAFNAKCLRDLCEDDHDLGFELMKRFSAIMSKRLHAVRVQSLDLYRAPRKGQ